MKVGFVPTWCISGFGLSRGGFGLVEVRRVHNSVRCQYFLSRSSSYQLSTPSYIDLLRRYHVVPSVVSIVRSCYSTIWRLSSYAFFSARNHLICAFLLHRLSRSSLVFQVFISHPLNIRARPQHITIGGCPFNCRTTNRCATYVLKHPGYWCIRVWKVAPSRGRGQADA